MKIKNIIIIISVIAVLVLLIAGTIALLVSKIIDGFKPGGNPSGAASGDASSLQSDTQSSGKTDGSTGSGSGTGSPDSSNPSDGSSQGSAGGSTTSVAPGDTTKISVGSASGSKGDKVSIPVEISDNRGIMAMVAGFKYDASALKYTGYKRGTVFTGYGAGDITESNGLIQFVTVENNDVTKNGTIIYLEFEIIAAKAQESKITLTVNKDSIGNYNEELVPVITENGKVTIK